MNEILNKTQKLNKKQLLTIVMLIFGSWWAILYGSSFIWRNFKSDRTIYMTGFYLTAVALTYIIYLLVIPLILKIKSIKDICNFAGFNLRTRSIILSILFLLTTVFMLIIPGTLIENNAWLWNIQPPLVEELLFRGIIPALLCVKFKKVPSFIISVVLFALIHIMGVGGIQQLLVSTVFGIIFMLIVFQTKSIIPTIIFHYIVNSGNAISLVLSILIFICFEFILLSKYIYDRIKQKNNKKNTTTRSLEKNI